MEKTRKDEENTKKKEKGNCGYKRIWRFGRQSAANSQIQSADTKYFCQLLQ